LEFPNLDFAPAQELSLIIASQYAAVMGISQELHLTKNDFSNVGSAFFIAYLIAEVPNGKSSLRFTYQFLTRTFQDTFSRKFLPGSG
jgi:uncharacterized protein (DUF2062 family)